MSQTLDTALWYLGRGSGVTSTVLLTAAIVVGIVARSPRRPFGLSRSSWNLIHRTTSLTAVSLVAIHVVSLLFDPYAQLRIVDLAVPFLGAQSAVWLGLGTLAVDLTAAVTITALLRRRVGERVFRLVHWSSYALWPMAFFHGLLMGTDRGQFWFLGVSVACALVVWGFVLWRTSEEFGQRRSRSREARALA